MRLNELKKIYKYSDLDEAIIIDIQLQDYRDAYSDWDFSPFMNRDLDDNLTEYLLECSFEIPIKMKMIVNFHILNQEKNLSREEKSIIGMYNYFDYEIRKLKNYKIRVVKDIVTFFLIGSFLLVAGLYMDELLTNNIVTKVLTEGFFIGGWVMIWEMFTAWFFDIKKVTHKMKHFLKLKGSKIIYTYS